MHRDAIYQELRRSDSVLSFVLNGIFGGVYIVDRQRRLSVGNRVAEAITGHLANDVVGMAATKTSSPQ